MLHRPKLGEFTRPYPIVSPEVFENNLDNGCIIALEGVDGSGKTTISNKLVEYFENNGVLVYRSNFICSPYLLEIMLNSKWENCNPYTFALMYSTGLSYIYSKEIIKRLKQGYVVILDRYIYSIINRSIVKGVDKSWVSNLVSVFDRPRLSFFIDTPIEECLRRKMEKDRILSYWECGCDVFGREPYCREVYDAKHYGECFIKYQTAIRNATIALLNEDDNAHIIKTEGDSNDAFNTIISIIERDLK